MLNRKIHSSATTADYNSGKVGIGIGPFRLASYRPNDRIITNSAAGMATLLAGGVDFIDQIPTGDIGRLCADNRFRVAEAASLRSMHLTLASTAFTFSRTRMRRPGLPPGPPGLPAPPQTCLLAHGRAADPTSRVREAAVERRLRRRAG